MSKIFINPSGCTGSNKLAAKWLTGTQIDDERCVALVDHNIHWRKVVVG
jgi:hypothetical protein